MYVLMCYQTALLTEFLFTHITNTWALTNIYGLMNIKHNLLTECLPTYTVDNCVCVCVFWDCSLDWMTYCVLHINMDAPLYVCVDVVSDWPFDGIPFYTYHKYKDVHPYVYVDVLPDSSDDWMTYHTLYRHKRAHHCVCADVLSNSSYD